MNGRMSGTDFEVRLRTKLETWCKVEYDPTFDHQYKVDFVISRFKEIPKLPPQIGVQVTTKDNDVYKQAEFFRINQQGLAAPKNVFLEVDPQANLDGAAVIACFALGTFAFSRQYQEDTVTGLRIAKDLSFEFFNIKESVERLQKGRVEQQGTGGRGTKEEILEGEIVRYSTEKGYGFIKCPGYSEDFFFHISDTDQETESEIRDRAGESRGLAHYDRPIPVEFKNGGYNRPGVKNPQAFNVVLADLVGRGRERRW